MEDWEWRTGKGGIGKHQLSRALESRCWRAEQQQQAKRVQGNHPRRKTMERGGAGIWSRQLSPHIHVAVTGARTWQANGMDGRGKVCKCGIGQRQRKADDRGSGRILLLIHSFTNS